MIKQYKLSEIGLAEILNRDIREDKSAEGIVDEILQAVRERGDEALREYGEKFDHAKLVELEVSREEIEEALAATPAEFLATLKLARDNIRRFHSQQVRRSFVLTEEGGVVLGQKFTPIARAGLYVPGGTASYPSSVLMNAVPAKLAGVEELIMTTPPDSQGKIAPAILAAAAVAGVDRIFKVGGAQAIGALAYGTESIPKVDKIVGPGNIFVATAKRKVYGLVDIDMIAGPSEILVLADGSCNPVYVAADMLSQAEHDRLATAVLITTSQELADQVAAELERQLKELPREEIARASIENNGKLIVAESMEQAVAAANYIAPEHLEVCVEEPFGLLDSIKNAGSIFLGKNVPEALGDYLAGPNHTLPTSGTARFSSPLSVDDFVKKSSFIYYPKAALAKVADRIVDFAEREGLQGHGRSVSVRFQD